MSTLSDTVPAQGMKYYEAENPSMPVQAAWGLVTTDASVTVQAIFRRHTAGGNFYEAAVPASEGYSAFIVPFDATTFAPTSASMYTGFAIANLNPSATAHVVCAARDHLGQVPRPIPFSQSSHPTNSYHSITVFSSAARCTLLQGCTGNRRGAAS